MMKNRNDVWSFILWMIVGWVAVKVIEWLFPEIGVGVVPAFFIGAGVTFIVLSWYGRTLQTKDKQMKQAAMEQFIEDQKGEVEQQAKIDKEMIAQLRTEHDLSGEEQDQRLKALETALKHLRGR